MNRIAVIITIIILAAVVFCVGFVQRDKLFSLRREQQRLLDQLNSHQPLSTKATSKAPVVVGIPVSRELLQLRNRVNMLTHRSREFAGVRSENERLRLLLTERQTKGPTALPPGYIRKSLARMVGYNTPQDTLQSFLWAIKNHDTTNVLLALTPEQAKWYQSEAQRAGSFERLFEHSDALFGFSIVKMEADDDQTLEAEIELAPGLSPLSVNFQKIGNEWKLISLP